MPKHSLISPQQPRTKRKTPLTANIPLNGLTNEPSSTSQQQQPNGAQQQQTSLVSAAINEYEIVSSQTWAQIGSCSLGLNLFKLAIKSFDNSLRHLPDNVDSIIGLSKALKLEQGSSSPIGYKQSTELITSAIQQFRNLSGETKLWKELSVSHLGVKEYEQAHQAITRALSFAPNDTELLYLNAEILLKSQNYNYVKHILHTILSIYQNKATDLITQSDHEIIGNTHAKLAQLFILENNFKYAINEFRMAIAGPLPASHEKYEEYASIWINFALLKERLNEFDEGYQIINDAIKHIGNIPRLLIARSYFLLIPQTKFYDPWAAIQLLESAISQQRRLEEEDNTDFLTWYILGRAYSLVDSPRQAYDTFQISLGKGPNSPLPWLAVGSLYLKLGQLPDALAAYSQAARLQVEGPEASISQLIASATAWDGLACVYERCDDQARDAADACLRASACYRSAGDLRASQQAEQRAHSLTAASRGEAPPPGLKGPPDTLVVLLRDLIGLSSKEINELCQEPQVQQPQQQQAQDHQVSQQPQPQPQQVPQQQVQPIPQQQQPHQQQPQQQSGQPQAVRSIQGTPRMDTPKQFHHLPLPRQSLAGRSNTPEVGDATSSHQGTPQSTQIHPQQPQAVYTPIPGATPVLQNPQHIMPPQQQAQAQAQAQAQQQQQQAQAGQTPSQPQPTGYVIDVNHRGVPPYQGQSGVVMTGPPPPHGAIPIPGPPGLIASNNGQYPPPPPPGYAYVNGAAPAAGGKYVQWR